jgi:hypothetical protein
MKNTKGSAIGLVLIFLTVMLLIGSAMLAMSQFSLRSAAASALMDRHYYAAESGAQLAAQLLIHDLSGTEIYLSDSFDSPAHPGIDAMKNDLADGLRRIYAETKSRVEAQVFNGQNVTLGDWNPDINTVTVPLGEVGNPSAYAVLAYLDISALDIRAASGGRAVTAALTCGVTPSTDWTLTPGESIRNYFGSAIYDPVPLGNSVYGQVDEHTRPQIHDHYHRLMEAMDERIAYINSLEPDRTLYIEGDLSLSGAVDFGDTQTVYVGGRVTVSSGTVITGSGPGGTDFLIQGNRSKAGWDSNLPALNINPSVTILGCRFYVQGGSIHFSGAGNVTTDSVFFATKGAPASEQAGWIAIPTAANREVNLFGGGGRIGQFYAEGPLRLGINNVHSRPQGVFVTKSHYPIFFGPNADSPGITVAGLVVGNCGYNDTTGGAGYNTNAGAPGNPVNFRVGEFDFAGADADNLILDGGIFGTIRTLQTPEGGGEPDVIELTGELTAAIQFHSLSIMESSI